MRARISCLAAAVAVLLVTAAPAAADTECRYLADCDPVTSPWIAVPAGTVNAPGTAGYALPCAAGRYGAGFDWAPSNVDEALLDLPPGNWPGSAPVFVLRNEDDAPGTARVMVGCAPIPATTRQTAANGETGAAGATVRVSERRVRADRELTARHACASGERAVRGGGAVIFEQRAKPSRALLRGHTLDVRRTRRGVRATLVTGEKVGDDERVLLHLYAVCR